MGGKHLPMFLCFCSGKPCSVVASWVSHNIKTSFVRYQNVSLSLRINCRLRMMDVSLNANVSEHTIIAEPIDLFLKPKVDGRSPKELFQQTLYR